MIFDITPLISEELAVFPGDMPYQSKIAMSFEQGHNLRLGSLHGTFHLGAHTDAPSHYHPQGQDIAQRSLDPYIGPCTVLAVKRSKGLIEPQDLPSSPIKPRVLFKTESFPDPNRWQNDFMALSPALVEELARQGVVLIGIDTPSVDPATSKELPSHQAIYRHDIAILEGVVLTSVNEGDYELIALPLKIKGADASPVRAILRSL